MAVLFLDNFERVDSDALGNNWTEFGTKISSQTILNNSVNYNITGAGSGAAGCFQSATINNSFYRELEFEYKDNGSSTIDVKNHFCLAFENSTNYLSLLFNLDNPDNPRLNLLVGVNNFDLGTFGTLSGFIGTFRKFRLIQRNRKFLFYAENTNGTMKFVGNLFTELSHFLEDDWRSMGIDTKRGFNGSILFDVNYFQVRQLSKRRRY